MSGSYPWYAGVVLPATRVEFPGWGKLGVAFSIWGAKNDGLWQGAPRKTVRGKWHRYLMELDLADWSERQTYFLGRYCDLETQLALAAVLRPGDRFVDVGGNIGMISLHAAALVGPEGVVDTFEPNPACCTRIAGSIERNRIAQVRLHPCGLSDEPATLTLSILLNHTGMGTLAAIAPEQAAAVTQTVAVPVKTGDSVLLSDDRPITCIKIDVEGFETRALRGMRKTLDRWRPIVTTEVIAEWLGRAGSSAGELFEFMTSRGYRAFGMGTARQRLRHRLKLRPVADPTRPPSGVAWIADDSPARERLAPFIASDSRPPTPVPRPHARPAKALPALART